MTTNKKITYKLGPSFSSKQYTYINLAHSPILQMSRLWSENPTYCCLSESKRQSEGHKKAVICQNFLHI